MKPCDFDMARDCLSANSVEERLPMFDTSTSGFPPWQRSQVIPFCLWTETFHSFTGRASSPPRNEWQVIQAIVFSSARATDQHRTNTAAQHSVNAILLLFTISNITSPVKRVSQYSLCYYRLSQFFVLCAILFSRGCPPPLLCFITRVLSAKGLPPDRRGNLPRSIGGKIFSLRIYSPARPGDNRTHPSKTPDSRKMQAR
jgi:hypothetical protein